MRNRILSEVRVQLPDVDQHREWHHGDADLRFEPTQQVLGRIGSIERPAVAVVSRAGVIPTDDQVGASEIPPNDRVPDRFPRSRHPHRERQQGEHRGIGGIPVQQGLVAAHPRVMVDITGFGHANDGIDQDLAAHGTGCPHRQLLVDAMHGVAGLKRHDC